MRYRLKRQPGGAQALHDTTFGETMHPGAGPWAEAMGLYVEGSRLAERLLQPVPRRKKRGLGKTGKEKPALNNAGLENAGFENAIVVFDVGLGGGANALAAVECHQALQQAGRNPRPLHLVSFEQYTDGLDFALEEAEALGYPRGHEEALEDLLAGQQAEPGPGIIWDLRRGDFSVLVHEEPERADIIFFDPFSPRANPGMWSLETLTGLHGCRRMRVPTVLVTYSSAFNARAAMLLAGFFVGEGPRQERKGRGAAMGSTTVAATEYGALESPLTPGWLARWRREKDPWPPGTPPSRHRPLRTELVDHSQWLYDTPPEDMEVRTHSRDGRRGPHGSAGRNTSGAAGRNTSGGNAGEMGAGRRRKGGTTPGGTGGADPRLGDSKPYERKGEKPARGPRRPR